MRAVGDAITFASQHASVDANRIGLLGFSLGSYLALSVASVEPRVKVVVEFFGGMPEELHGFTRMPPVLILHGEDDRVVPVSRSDAAATIAGANGSSLRDEALSRSWTRRVSTATSFLTQVSGRFSS